MVRSLQLVTCTAETLPSQREDFRFFSVVDDDQNPKLRVGPIHHDQGYQSLRKALSDQYNLGSREPNIQVWNMDRRGDRALTLPREWRR